MKRGRGVVGFATQKPESLNGVKNVIRIKLLLVKVADNLLIDDPPVMPTYKQGLPLIKLGLHFLNLASYNASFDNSMT
jgi:hypothetical protein